MALDETASESDGGFGARFYPERSCAARVSAPPLSGLVVLRLRHELRLLNAGDVSFLSRDFEPAGVMRDVSRAKYGYRHDC